jgi:hypothetical protein
LVITENAQDKGFSKAARQVIRRPAKQKRPAFMRWSLSEVGLASALNARIYEDLSDRHSVLALLKNETRMKLLGLNRRKGHIVVALRQPIVLAGRNCTLS